ncbi:fatty acyl-AMP ligase [Amycolatopsis vancoresmycina]|uniref:fatty acyl-AMP ligase n=1 Tax=Amycolatopsis vancoresmycina TaxID=208444 RepID=UPI00068FE941|nr:fatty acyl-AMP ligase [Amycolatopsis vancoresmycina]
MPVEVKVPEFTFEPVTVSLARHAAGARSADPAFTFLDFGGGADGVPDTLSWLDLDRRARAIAVRLDRLAEPGDRVAVLCPQNLDYVAGFLAAVYAGMTAVPLVVPGGPTHLRRLVGALGDCVPRVWLTSSEALPAVRQLQHGGEVPAPRRVLVVDRIGTRSADEFLPVHIDEEQPAYLQYTSGSTRRPAGAVITHRALLANIRQAQAAFDLDASTTSVGWLPFFHDMGLLQLICLPVVLGCRTVFTTPAAFTRRPVRWLRMLASHPDVLTAAPNFAFEYAAAKLTPAERAGLDLSRVKVAINGSEPVRDTTVTGFLAALAGTGFPPTAHRPSYGLAEATVFVTTTPAGTEPRAVAFDRDQLGKGTAVPAAGPDARPVTMVSVGRPAGQHLRIVDPDLGHVLPDGEVGEIWLHGPNVASGYWARAAESDHTFDGRLTGAEPGVPADGWLRTGDLGVRHDGELFVTARLKDLIVVDGRNHHPQDIEATAQDAHGAIQRDRVAAFSVEQDGREVPVLVAERVRTCDADPDVPEVERAVRAAVSRHHDLRLADFVLVRPGSVPRTSSGKIARSEARDRYLDGVLAAGGGETR